MKLCRPRLLPALDRPRMGRSRHLKLQKVDYADPAYKKSAARHGCGAGHRRQPRLEPTPSCNTSPKPHRRPPRLARGRYFRWFEFNRPFPLARLPPAYWPMFSPQRYHRQQRRRPMPCAKPLWPRIDRVMSHLPIVASLAQAATCAATARGASRPPTPLRLRHVARWSVKTPKPWRILPHLAYRLHAAHEAKTETVKRVLAASNA